MPLSSASTLEEIKAAYKDNASYLEDGSVPKCKAFITACRILILQIPTLARQGGGEELQMNVQLVQQEKAAAEKWLAVNDTGGSGPSAGYVHADMRGYRD